MRKLFALFAVGLMLTVLLSNVAAAGPGSLRIELKEHGNPIKGAEVRICKAGHPVQGGYILANEYGGGFVTEMDVMLPALAQWLAEKGGAYTSENTDTEGIAAFYGLEEGLYLVIQEKSAEGYTPIVPFLITLPWDGNVWEITASPKTERLPSVLPETSDPGIADRGIRGMCLSALGLFVMVCSRKKWLA